MDAHISRFQKLANNRFLFQLYLLHRLPLAFIAGIKVNELVDKQAVITVRYKWLTQNPFRSMYFACLAMAAEMSTGLLVIDRTYQSNPTISMLIIGNSATYIKKAVGKITFTCNSGEYISETVEKAKQTGASCVIELPSIGIDEAGDCVAEFIFTWSIKAKSNKI